MNRFDPSREASVVPKETADRLYNLLRNFEQSLRDLAYQFYEGDVNTLETTIKSLQSWGQQLNQRVDFEIERSRGELTCCKVVHSFPKQNSQTWIYVGFVFIVLCILVLFCSCSSQEEDGPILAVTNRMY